MTVPDVRALIVVDMQEGFLDSYWGRTVNFPGCEANVNRLIAAWSAADQPIVVVRHDSVDPGSPLHPSRPGNALVGDVAKVRPDLLVTKTVNAAFYGEPRLEDWLRSSGIASIVLCGIQTNMCVETTARVGGNLGFDVSVALDATRTFDLPAHGGGTISAESLMQTTAANLQSGDFARVTTSQDLIHGLQQTVERSRGVSRVR